MVLGDDPLVVSVLHLWSELIKELRIFESFPKSTIFCGALPLVENPQVLTPVRHTDLKVKVNGRRGSALPVFPIR
jgi:hypothetical protein